MCLIIKQISLPVVYVARNKYLPPIPLDNLISTDTHSSPAHLGRLENAVDFVAPENTTILAAAEGTVTYVKDDSDIGGQSVNFWHYRSESCFFFCDSIPRLEWIPTQVTISYLRKAI